MENFDIQKVLPHRYPFLLVDRVTEREVLKWAKGIKNVTRNEWFMNANSEPTMPEVLILEAIGQLGAFVLPEEETDIGLLSGVKNAVFLKPVYPGDRLDLYFEVIKKRATVFKGRGYAMVDGEKVVEVDEITVSYLRE